MYLAFRYADTEYLHLPPPPAQAEESEVHMRTMALFCFRHAGYVLAGWLAALAALGVLGHVMGSHYQDALTLPDSDSTRAQQLLQSIPGGEQLGARDRIVLRSVGTPVSDPSVRSRVDPMFSEVSALPHISGVISPYQDGTRQISADHRTAYATVYFDTGSGDVTADQARRFVDTVRRADRPGLVQAEVTGPVAKRASPYSLGGAYIGLAAAAVVLLITFGSLFSMLLPVLTAIVSVGTGLSVVGLLTHAMDVAEISPEIAVLMGLGVGVDYALFIVTRYRQGLLAGLPPQRALAEAAGTSGRSVLFAGVTVCVAMLGMFAVRLDYLYGLAVASSIAVLFTMAASLTLLPALLRLLGPRALSRRERRGPTADELSAANNRTRWRMWALMVTRRPVPAALAALAVLVVLALPVLSMRLGTADQGLDAKGSTTRKGYDLLAEGFGPGINGPLIITGRVSGAAQSQSVTRLAERLPHTPGLASASAPTLRRAHDGARILLLTVYPRAAPQDRETSELVDRLRQQTIPAALSGTSAHWYVGGTTAVYDDFAQAVTRRLAPFIAMVVTVSFLILLVVFRSLLIPLTAAVMNLLAAGTAFGVIVAVFQWGWLDGLIGVDHTGPIEPYIPVLLFAGLFGLSMDYEVFLIARIQEEWRRYNYNRAAVVNGLAMTGRTITAAATIMVVVFASFVIGGQRIIKMAGLGLAIAVLLDSLIIRTALVPAVMSLLDRTNWWLPEWLDRHLPRLDLGETGADDLGEPGQGDNLADERQAVLDGAGGTAPADRELRGP